MKTHGYERSRPWKLSLVLIDQVAALTDTIENDAFGMAGKLKGLAIDTPPRAALAFEQLDYDSARQHVHAASDHLLNLVIQARVAQHLGLITPRQLADLGKRVDALDKSLAELPDELFEDDGLSEAA